MAEKKASIAKLQCNVILYHNDRQTGLGKNEEQHQTATFEVKKQHRSNLRIITTIFCLIFSDFYCKLTLILNFMILVHLLTEGILPY